jgi:AcrR family transcriptional regulator
MIDDGSLEEYRLPRGRHGLSREDVAANQYWRLIEATTALVAERGVAAVTGRAIAQRAGVSSVTLYERLGGRDAALTAAHKVAAGSLIKRIGLACEENETGEGGLAGALEAACTWASREPQLVAMMGLGPVTALRAVAEARRSLIEDLAERLALVAPGRGAIGSSGRRLMVAATLTVLSERAAGLDELQAAALAAELTRLFA